MKEIPLTMGLFALIDDEDYDLVSKYKWYARKDYNTYYAVGYDKDAYNNGVGRNIRMHRLIMGLDYGNKMQVDHINHNGLDNRRENLRIVTHRQNCFNKRKQEECSSKHKGVGWRKAKKKWCATIVIDYQYIVLGHFDNEIEAARMYDRVALFEFKEFACTNFPAADYSTEDLLSAENAIKLREEKRIKNKSSKFHGVYWKRGNHKWAATTRVNHRCVHVGLFKDEIEAALAYNDYVIKNNLNRKINTEIYHYYIAGGMTGLPNNNREKFSAAAKVLDKLGLTYFNPSDSNLPTMTYEECLQVDLDVIINKSMGVVAIPGWRKSKGANAEILVANVCGKPVYELAGEELVKVDTSVFRLPYNI